MSYTTLALLITAALTAMGGPTNSFAGSVPSPMETMVSVRTITNVPYACYAPGKNLAHPRWTVIVSYQNGYGYNHSYTDYGTNYSDVGSPFTVQTSNGTLSAEAYAMSPDPCYLVGDAINTSFNECVNHISRITSNALSDFVANPTKYGTTPAAASSIAVQLAGDFGGLNTLGYAACGHNLARSWDTAHTYDGTVYAGSLQ
jgi:hypothetical protein